MCVRACENVLLCFFFACDWYVYEYTCERVCAVLRRLPAVVAAAAVEVTATAAAAAVVTAATATDQLPPLLAVPHLPLGPLGLGGATVDHHPAAAVAAAVVVPAAA